jgi:hypothetical protein
MHRLGVGTTHDMNSVFAASSGRRAERRRRVSIRFTGPRTAPYWKSREKPRESCARMCSPERIISLMARTDERAVAVPDQATLEWRMGDGSRDAVQECPDRGVRSADFRMHNLSGADVTGSGWRRHGPSRRSRWSITSLADDLVPPPSANQPADRQTDLGRYQRDDFGSQDHRRRAKDFRPCSGRLALEPMSLGASLQGAAVWNR